MSIDPADAVAASTLVSSATIAALLRELLVKEVLDAGEVREIYETALLLLEQQQGQMRDGRAAFAAARAVLERSLRQAG